MKMPLSHSRGATTWGLSETANHLGQFERHPGVYLSGLILYHIEIIDLFEFHEGFSDGLKLRQLFLCSWRWKTMSSRETGRARGGEKPNNSPVPRPVRR